MTPLDRVGIYVPGGKAAYPSSVLMNAIPAQGGRRRRDRHGGADAAAASAIRWCSPPRTLAGVDRVFTIGGAQAIGALAYGTATVPRVDKITGPGNAYVASAKRRVFGTVGIDMIAGPSEILVLADGTTPPDWVAMDLFSQAEHDELAQSILLCPDAGVPRRGAGRDRPAAARRCRAATIIRASLEGRGALIHTRSMEEACEISNRIAPEHLEISAPRAAALGAAAAGTPARSSSAPSPARAWATTAPARTTCCRPAAPRASRRRSASTTSRSARSLIEVSERGAPALGPIAAELAHGEGLQAHARAAELRLERRRLVSARRSA